MTNATVVQAFSSGKIRANSRFSASTIATRYRNEAAVRSIEPGADKNGSSLSHVGSRVRSEFACNEVDDGGEIAVGAIAAGFGLGRLDKAVDAFEDAVFDAGVVEFTSVYSSRVTMGCKVRCDCWDRPDTPPNFWNHVRPIRRPWLPE